MKEDIRNVFKKLWVKVKKVKAASVSLDPRAKTKDDNREKPAGGDTPPTVMPFLSGIRGKETFRMTNPICLCNRMEWIK